MDKATRTRLARLADPARTHEQLRADAVKRRNAAIYQESIAGATLAELREATGLSTSQVHKIILAETAARQVVHVEHVEED